MSKIVEIKSVEDCKKVKRDKNGMRFKDGFPYFNVDDEHILIDLSKEENSNKTISIKLPNGKSMAIAIMDDKMMIPTICDITVYNEEEKAKSKVHGISKGSKGAVLKDNDIYSLEIL